MGASASRHFADARPRCHGVSRRDDASLEVEGRRRTNARGRLRPASRLQLHRMFLNTDRPDDRERTSLAFFFRSKAEMRLDIPRRVQYADDLQWVRARPVDD
jgi:hypothetical protein